jgi:hypothetical protein
VELRFVVTEKSPGRRRDQDNANGNYKRQKKDTKGGPEVFE